MVTAVVESPLRQRQRQRLRSPLATSSDITSGVGVGDGDELELAHRRRPAKRASGSGGGMRGRWAPPEIEIPTNGATAATARGYTSLRDIMSSPEYAAAGNKASSSSSSSPNEDPAGSGSVSGGGGGGDVHMIRHPLVKHAAYAYLQLTPSAREAEARRRRTLLRRRQFGCGGGGALCRVLFGCLGFLGALFGGGR